MYECTHVCMYMCTPGSCICVHPCTHDNLVYRFTVVPGTKSKLIFIFVFLFFSPCLFLLGPAVCSSKWLKSHPFSNAARPHLFWDHLDHHFHPDHPDSPSLLAVHETPWPKILPLPPNWTHSMLGCPGCFGCLGCVPCVGLRR